MTKRLSLTIFDPIVAHNHDRRVEKFYSSWWYTAWQQVLYTLLRRPITTVHLVLETVPCGCGEIVHSRVFLRCVCKKQAEEVTRNFNRASQMGAIMNRLALNTGLEAILGRGALLGGKHHATGPSEFHVRDFANADEATAWLREFNERGRAEATAAGGDEGVGMNLFDAFGSEENVGIRDLGGAYMLHRKTVRRTPAQKQGINWADIPIKSGKTGTGDN